MSRQPKHEAIRRRAKPQRQTLRASRRLDANFACSPHGGTFEQHQRRGERRVKIKYRCLRERLGGTVMSAEMTIYSPEELGRPLGQYNYVTRVKASEFVFVAGMLPNDAAGNVIGGGDVAAQAAQVFRNIEIALKSAGASWPNVVQFTTYLVHSQDIPKFMDFRLQAFPKMFPEGKYPPNTLIVIDRLLKESCLVEVATVAAL
jgi:enamine deaminase RidA (YjgF/YER057c/UK114 family)